MRKVDAELSTTDTDRTDTGQMITVMLIPQAADDLDKACERGKLTRTDVVNRAVSLYEFLDEERADGAQLLLRRRDGSTYQVGLL
jgi:hypothetical protein